MIASANKWWVVVGIAGLALIVAGKDVWAPKQKPPRAEVKPREMSVVSVLRINESETVKELTVPSQLLPSEPLLDTRCLIYVNKDINQAVMNCPPGVTGRPE